MTDKLAKLEKMLVDGYTRDKASASWNNAQYHKALSNSTPPKGFLGKNAYKYESDPMLDTYAARAHDYEVASDFACELLSVIYGCAQCPKCSKENSVLRDIDSKHGVQRELWMCIDCKSGWIVTR